MIKILDDDGGERQTNKDRGCHTFSLVCIRHYR